MTLSVRKASKFPKNQLSVHGKFMKRYLFYILLVLIGVFWIGGCQAGSQKERAARPAHAAHENEDAFSDIGSDALQSPYYHYMKARFCLGENDPDKAAELLKKAIDLDPESLFLKKELVSLYVSQDKTEPAMSVTEKILEKRPENTEALLMLAKLQIKAGDTQKAKETYHRILGLEPENKNIHLVLGDIYMEEGNLEQAFDIYSKMAESFPGSYVARFFMGKIHMMQNNPAEAEKAFLKTMALKPDLVAPRFELINIYKSRESEQNIPSSRIMDMYKEILDVDEDNTRARMEMAIYLHNHGAIQRAEKLFRKLGSESLSNKRILMTAVNEFLTAERYKDAAVLFTGMLKAAPGNDYLNFLAGLAFDSLEQYEAAINYFSKVSPASEYYKKSMIHTAFLHKQTGRSGEGVALLEKLHGRSPEDVDIITFLAAFYEDTNAYKKCIRLLEKGLASNKDNAALYFQKGVCQDKSGNKQGCIEAMKKVISVEPENADALNYLGYTYAEMGIKLDRAKSLISRALEIKPDDGYITDSLGWVYYKKGLYAKARQLLEKAAELTSYDPVITEHLGDAYFQEKKFDKALALYKKALEKTSGEKKENILQLKKKIQQTRNSLNDSK